MTTAEFNALTKNTLVRVIKSGKIYRTRTIITNAAMAEQNARRVADPANVKSSYNEALVASGLNNTDFVMQRNGKDFGPIRDLKPENIELVEA